MLLLLAQGMVLNYAQCLAPYKVVLRLNTSSTDKLSATMEGLQENPYNPLQLWCEIVTVTPEFSKDNDTASQTRKGSKSLRRIVDRSCGVFGYLRVIPVMSRPR